MSKIKVQVQTEEKRRGKLKKFNHWNKYDPLTGEFDWEVTERIINIWDESGASLMESQPAKLPRPLQKNDPEKRNG